MIDLIVSIVMGYCLGSIPFGLVITKLAGLGDIRSIGSGNIGATNVLRTGRKDLALATLVLDGGKGAIAVAIAMMAGLRPEVAGAAAFLGHCYPIWLGFKGGKGVATFLGTLLMLSLQACLMACTVWLVTAAIVRMSSLSALIAAAATPLILFAMGKPIISIATAFMAVIVFIRHIDNIKRLLDGTEPRIGEKNKIVDTPNNT